ncbi:MAG: hypothetical protein ACRD0E_02710, partial [Acidimicrobiales bacterium]
MTDPTVEADSTIKADSTVEADTTVEAVTETTVEPSASAEERVRQFLLSLGTGNEEIDAAIEDESL